MDEATRELLEEADRLDAAAADTDQVIERARRFRERQDQKIIRRDFTPRRLTYDAPPPLAPVFNATQTEALRLVLVDLRSWTRRQVAICTYETLQARVKAIGSEIEARLGAVAFETSKRQVKEAFAELVDRIDALEQRVSALEDQSNNGGYRG